jgi:hypothetical protein
MLPSMTSQQLEKLTASWFDFIGCIAHDVRTPLLSIGFFCHSLSEMLPHFIKGYQLAVEHQLMEEVIHSRRLMQLEKAGLDSVGEDVRRLMNFFTYTCDFTKELVDFSAIQIFSVKSWLNDSLKKYPFKDDKLRTLVHVNIEEDFNFRYLPLFADRLCHTVLKIFLDEIERNKKGEIYLSTEENRGEHLLHFKCTAGGMCPTSLTTCLSKFFSEEEEQNPKLLPGLGFCKLALVQLNGDLIANFQANEYTDFMIKLPPAVEDI